MDPDPKTWRVGPSHRLYTRWRVPQRPFKCPLGHHCQTHPANGRECGGSSLPSHPRTQPRTSISLLEEVYRTVLTHTPAERVVLCGDSAGGNLALAQAILYRDLNLLRPARLVLFAPWLDLTLSDPEIRQVETRDVLLRVDSLRPAGLWWAGNNDPHYRLLSPLYGDLRDLPPIDIFSGTDDIFIVDIRTFKARASSVKTAVHLYETPGGFHVFMGLTWLPEARAVYHQIGQTLRLRT